MLWAMHPSQFGGSLEAGVNTVQVMSRTDGITNSAREKPILARIHTYADHHLEEPL